MFFSSKAKTSAIHASVEKLQARRAEIKDKMADAEAISIKLGEAVRKTQEMTSELADKVNRETKIAKKSLTSISAKLKEGLIMLDHLGKIIHLNKTGSKIFGVAESEVLGKTLSDLVECGNNLHDRNGNIIPKPILKDDFFINLSTVIFNKIMNSSEKYLVCNECLKNALPFCFEGGIDKSMAVDVIYKGKEISLKISLSVLDNDPESLQDVNYIFLFSIIT